MPFYSVNIFGALNEKYIKNILSRNDISTDRYYNNIGYTHGISQTC
ncbi:hypothetical protein XIS1_1400007 [Xenorhabdus innexi]|uniref:Uncharacterized protein n=1 Tax=Xenorhabdus innexi TaxID=290109 RepID=A0A1N6MTX4_9GAMM|nr:hypothetical protein XIS1_1400007 [Xenorhabdus innexi]